MSIREEVNRIKNLRNAIRNKLSIWGLVSDTASLEDCKTAIVGIADHTNATVGGDFSKGETGFITGKISDEGYYNGNSKIRIPVANFSVENIKKDVVMGGLKGELDYVNYGELKFSIYSGSSYKVRILDESGLKYEGTGGSEDGSVNFVGNIIALYSYSAAKNTCSGCNFLYRYSGWNFFKVTNEIVNITLSK